MKLRCCPSGLADQLQRLVGAAGQQRRCVPGRRRRGARFGRQCRWNWRRSPRPAVPRSRPSLLRWPDTSTEPSDPAPPTRRPRRRAPALGRIAGRARSEAEASWFPLRRRGFWEREKNVIVVCECVGFNVEKNKNENMNEQGNVNKYDWFGFWYFWREDCYWIGFFVIQILTSLHFYTLQQAAVGGIISVGFLW